ncbi:MAG: hypothetical protein CFE30_26660 [Bradyrhizobium sp. PARBB1]|nr:MAG: hypothetical protein CFE30_26660 [Bradyrhizobium sp. PARBB1]PSO26649.1 hypothetical protein C7G43_11260 [Bradyrhizobium sp. MOS004]
MMYWGNHAKTREAFQGGLTKSGNKCVRNAGGTYTYAGRSDDMLPCQTCSERLSKQQSSQASQFNCTDRTIDTNVSMRCCSTCCGWTSRRTCSPR